MTSTIALREGDELPPFVRTTGFAEWNRFAAVNDEFVPIHMDDTAGQSAGLPGAIGMGLLQVSYLHNALRAWLDGRGRITSFKCRFSGVNLKDSEVTASGKVTGVSESDGKVLAELEIWTVDGLGQKLASGTCSVELDG
jgi:acyl dehydratase